MLGGGLGGRPMMGGGGGAMGRPPAAKEKCDALIRRAAGIADLVRGTSKAVELRSCMQWRTDIYTIVTQDQHAAPYIFAQLREFFKDDIQRNFIQEGKKAKDLFLFVANFFRDFKAIAKAIEFAFAYLDQYFTKRSDCDPLQVMIYKTFRASGYDVIKGALLESIVSRMNAWRDGEQQNLDNLRSSIDFFQTIGQATNPRRTMTGSGTNAATVLAEMSLFNRDFLEPCITRSKAYYKVLGARRQAAVLEEGVVGYFGWAEKQLAREETLMRTLGLSSSWGDIKGGLVATLVTEPHLALLRNTDCGLAALLREGRDVSVIFGAVSLIPEGHGLESMASVYSQFISESVNKHFAEAKAAATGGQGGEAKAAADQAEQQAMKAVMAFLQQQRLAVIPQQMGASAKLLGAWDMGASVAFKENVQVPRLLSSHVGAYLAASATAGGGGGGDDEAAEASMLEFFKTCFACVVQKDEFFANYKASLAHRLLRGQYRRTTESQMLARLKLVSGNAEVYPLNAMISDIDNSDKLSSEMLGGVSMEAFLSREKLKARTILVTSQYWPTFEYVEVRPAPVMANFIALFESFYQIRFPNRRIRWVFQSSTASITARFTQGPKELSGSLLQATVLLLLDGAVGAGMRIPEVVEATGLPKEQIADAVASMYMNKRVNVLECVDPATGAVVDTKRITDALRFRLNVGFKAPVRKLDLPKPKTAKGVDMSQIENLRKELAKIAIVRYMKSRGSAMYPDMVEGTLSDLRRKFDAQPPLIKSQLEFLIDKEMVRRDESDPKLLIYIA